MNISLAQILIITVITNGIYAKIVLNNEQNYAEVCVNSILQSLGKQNDLAFLINTDIKTKFLEIRYNTNSEYLQLGKFQPNFYIVKGNLSEIFENLFEKMLLYSKKPFIIFADKIDGELLKIFEEFYIYNIVILIDVDNELRIYKSKSTPHRKLEIYLFDLCSKINANTTIFNEPKILKKISILYEISPPLIINTTEGIYMELVNTILSNLKIQPNYKNVERIATVIKVNDEFKTRKYDMYVAQVNNRMTEYPQVEKTFEIIQDIMVFVTPNMKTDDRWSIFTHQFKPVVWMLFGLVFLILYSLFQFTAYLIPNANVGSTLFLFLSVLFEGTANVRVKSPSFNLLFLNYAIFCLIFATVYKSKMFDLMRQDSSSQQIQTRRDILKSSLAVALSDRIIITLFKKSTDPFERSLAETHLLWCPTDYWRCINKTAFDKDIITVRLKMELEYYVPIYYLEEDGTSKLNILDKDYQDLMDFVLIFRMGHPTFDVFNKKLKYLYEAGIVEFITSKFKRKFMYAMTLARLKTAQYRPLCLITLLTTFIVYFVCISISLIVFCAEHVLFHYNKI